MHRRAFLFEQASRSSALAPDAKARRGASLRRIRPLQTRVGCKPAESDYLCAQGGIATSVILGIPGRERPSRRRSRTGS